MLQACGLTARSSRDEQLASPAQGVSSKDGAAGTSPTPTRECTPTFDSLRTHVFGFAGDGAGGHGTVNPAAGVSLLNTSPERLAMTSSALCSGWSLVVPGSPERSCLCEKLTAAQPACGDVMPLGPERAARRHQRLDLLWGAEQLRVQRTGTRTQHPVTQ